MICTHEIWEMDTASHADGMCPLCLSDKNARLSAVLSNMAKQIELVAFKIPPPNIYTPQLVMIANLMRSAP